MSLLRRVPKFFTYKQTAEILNIEVCDVKELIADGLLIESRLNSKWRISEANLLNFIKVVDYEDCDCDK